MKVKLLYLPRYEVDYNTGKPMDGTGWYDFYIPPIGMPILTSFLKRNGIKVEQDDLLIKVCRKKIDLSPFASKEKINKFINERQEETLEEIGERMLRLTKAKGYDVIGFSIYEADNPTTAIIALVIAKILKERYEPTIIIGGRGLGNLKETLLKSGFIDYGIVNKTFDAPAELNLLKFCEAWEKGKFGEEKIPGLQRIENGRMVENPTHYDKKEIDLFPMPCFDGIPLELYRYEMSREIDGKECRSKILILPYIFVKGCPHECAFCCNSISPWATKPPERVAEELEYLRKKWKTKYFYFLNTTVNPTYGYANKLADALAGLDVKWADSANFVPVDKKLLKKLKGAGAVKLIFGMESGSSRILKYIDKNLKLGQAEKVLRYALEVGILTEINLICGFPHEKDSDIDQTISFLKKNKKYIKTAFVNKFFLEGKMRVHPERYGIRIRKEAYEPSQALKEEWRGGFDEMGGLKWQERVRLTEKSFNRIMRAMAKIGIRRGSTIHETFFRSSLPIENKNGA